MTRQKTIINGVTFLLAAFFISLQFEAVVEAQSTSLKICASNTNGSMRAKKKCKSSETTLNWFDLQSTLSKVCTIRSAVGASTNDPSTGNPALAEVLCNIGETMTTWGYQTVPPALVVLRQATVQSENGLPIGIAIISQCEYYGCNTSYSLVASAVCCRD